MLQLLGMYAMQIGGGNFFDKAAALHFLASRCDGLVFVGKISFQIMHELGVSVPLSFVEHGALKEALDIVQFAHNRDIQILYPKDFWCKNDCLLGKLELFPAHSILDGWVPVDLGPMSLDEINSLLTECKKVMWIGPVKFSNSSQHTNGASKLAQMLDLLSQSNCDLTVIGNMACKVIMQESSSISEINMLENASVVWEFLKGRKLPGVTALDRDNILPKLMTSTGSYEDLLRKEISKYDRISEDIAHNIEAQEQLLLQIQAQNDDFSAIFNLEDYKGCNHKSKAAMQRFCHDQRHPVPGND
ncbi:hypothetical protein ACB098_11G140000 [Castanea mollissima]